MTRDYGRERIANNVNVERQQFIKQRLTQHEDKQRQHIPGTKEYNERIQNDWRKYKQGKPKQFFKPGYFTISENEIDKIVKNKANLNKLSERQYFKVDYPIGYYRTVKNGERMEYETNRMQVHFGKKGYHAVPSPLSQEVRENGRK